MWLPRCLACLAFLCLSLAKDCSYKYYERKYISIINSITNGHKGLLASLFNIADRSECVRQCSFFDNCYLATYQKRGNIGFCNLYYYHFPAKYKFEAESPLRIVQETNWFQSEVIFNISCRTSQPKELCTAEKFESRKVQQPAKYIGVWEKTDPIKVLTVEQCIAACDYNGTTTDNCMAAVFSPPKSTESSVFGDCHRLKGLSPNQVIADTYFNPTQVLVGNNAKCRKAGVPCRFETLKEVYGTVNDLELPPDIHYATDSSERCARVCGTLPDCVEAEFTPAINFDTPICHLFRSSLAQSARRTLHIAGPNEHKIRITKIQCPGVRREHSNGQPETFKSKNKVQSAQKQTQTARVAQQLSNFPSRSKSGRVTRPPRPVSVTLSLPQRGAKISGYRLDEIAAAGGPIHADTNSGQGDDIDSKVRSN